MTAFSLGARTLGAYEIRVEHPINSARHVSSLPERNSTHHFDSLLVVEKEVGEEKGTGRRRREDQLNVFDEINLERSCAVRQHVPSAREHAEVKNPRKRR